MMLVTMVVQTSVREPLGVNSRGCKKGLTNLKHRSSRRDNETHFLGGIMKHRSWNKEEFIETETQTFVDGVLNIMILILIIIWKIYI